MAFAPVVLSSLTLPALLNDILTSRNNTAPSTLIVCSSRDAFLRTHVRSLQQEEIDDADVLHRLLAPTLQNLASARHVNITFCESVQALAAYLAVYAGARPGKMALIEEKEVLILVNPLSLHAPTPSFSAQGLSRTFATAVETAQRINAKLLVVECSGAQQDFHYHDTDDDDVRAALEDGRSSPVHLDEDPWEQQVPILNVSARRFGSGSGDRAWAGRTVKVKTIAARWFKFQRVSNVMG